MSKKRGKQTINTYKPQQLKETFEADITIFDSGNCKTLKQKEVSIYKGARGLDLLVVDGAIYPTRTFKDSVTPFVEKRFKSSIAYIIVAGVFVMLLEQIWIMNLLTDEQYFNPVSIFLIVAVCGALLFVLNTLKRQRVPKLFLQKYRKEWLQVGQQEYSDRTIEKYRGYSASMVLGGLFAGVVIAFVIAYSLFSVIQLSLLDSVSEGNQWVVTSVDEAERILNLYMQTRSQLNVLFYVVIAIVLILVSVYGVTIFLNARSMKEEQKKPMAYMGDLINFNEKTGKFQPVHAYINPFEDDQKDVNTVDAVTLQLKTKETIGYEIDKDPKKEIDPEHRALIFEDQEQIEVLSIEEARKTIQKTYAELTGESEKDYKAKKVLDIVTDQKRQLVTFYEIMNLFIHQIDSLEAENNGLKAGQETLVDKLEEKEIMNAGIMLEDKRKKLDLVHWLLIAFSGSMFIGLVILIIIIATSGGVIV